MNSRKPQTAPLAAAKVSLLVPNLASVRTRPKIDAIDEKAPLLQFRDLCIGPRQARLTFTSRASPSKKNLWVWRIPIALFHGEPGLSAWRLCRVCMHRDPRSAGRNRSASFDRK